MPARRRILVSLLIACASALPALAPAGAALLNWEGTLTLHWSDWPPAEIPGGGVASVNASGGVPAHLDSLVLEASRGRVGPASATFLVTDPEAAGGLVAAYRFEGVELAAVGVAVDLEVGGLVRAGARSDVHDRPRRANRPAYRRRDARIGAAGASVANSDGVVDLRHATSHARVANARVSTLRISSRSNGFSR